MRRGAALVALGIALAGCKTASGPVPGGRNACTCTYLTDYDDTAHVAIDVCIASGKKAEEEARYCAAENAHNHIDRCDCRPTGAPCDARAKDACQQR